MACVNTEVRAQAGSLLRAVWSADRQMASADSQQSTTANTAAATAALSILVLVQRSSGREKLGKVLTDLVCTLARFDTVGEARSPKKMFLHL